VTSSLHRYTLGCLIHISEPMHLVTLRQLSAATCDVGRKLDRLGFYNEAVQAVDVYLVAICHANGWASDTTLG